MPKPEPEITITDAEGGQLRTVPYKHFEAIYQPKGWVKYDPTASLGAPKATGTTKPGSKTASERTAGLPKPKPEDG